MPNEVEGLITLYVSMDVDDLTHEIIDLCSEEQIYQVITGLLDEYSSELVAKVRQYIDTINYEE